MIWIVAYIHNVTNYNLHNVDIIWNFLKQICTVWNVIKVFQKVKKKLFSQVSLYNTGVLLIMIIQNWWSLRWKLDQICLKQFKENLKTGFSKDQEHKLKFCVWSWIKVKFPTEENLLIFKSSLIIFATFFVTKLSFNEKLPTLSWIS